MNATTYRPAPAKQKLIGLAGVVIFHALLFWAIQAGLTRTVTQKMPAVVQALLLEEKRPEPPSLPPAPPAPPAPALPKSAPPPPTYAAPAETPAAVTSAMQIATQKSPSTVESSSLAPSTSQSQQNKPPSKTGPVGIYCAKPEYPMGSKRMEEEGVVNLLVHVGIDGHVSKVIVTKSSGYKRLDDAAKNEVLRWRFKPATVDGVPVDDSFTRSFKFLLDTGQTPSSSETTNSPC